MQRKPANLPETNGSANQNSEDAAINARLTDVIKSNAVRLDQDAPSRPQMEKLGIVRGTQAFLGLIGLMIVAYIYSLLIKKEA